MKTLEHAVTTYIDPRTRSDLQEAIREVQILAGLDSSKPQSDQAPRHITVGVTSPDYRDGKTTVAIALASSLGHDFEMPVTLVDADLHTHSIARQYQLYESVGLAELVTGEATLDDTIHQVDHTTIRILPAGRPKADPGRVARSERLGPVIDEIRQQSVNVVLDLPSVLHSMNTPALAQRCDGVIVVVRHGKTSRAQLDRTLHLLRDANVIGVVVNRHRTSIPGWVQRSLGLRR